MAFNVRVSVIWLAASVGLLAIGTTHAQRLGPRPPDGRIEFQPAGVPGTAFATGVELLRGQGVRARYYRFAKPGGTSKPIVIVVPGSGCDGAVRLGPDGKAMGGAELFALPRLADVDVFALEPPGIPRQFASPHSGGAEGCPEAFLKGNGFLDVITTYQLALKDITSHMTPDTPVMIIGSSDGAVMAAALAGGTNTTHLVLISGFGIAQATSHMTAMLGDAFGTKVSAESIDAVRDYRAHLADARAHPQSGTVWKGQAMSRWSSTAYMSSPDLIRTMPATVNVLVVRGGRDTSWAPEAFRSGLAELLQIGRGMSVKYILCADHQLACAGSAPAPKYLGETIQQALAWFLDGKPDASWTVFADSQVARPTRTRFGQPPVNSTPAPHPGKH